MKLTYPAGIDNRRHWKRKMMKSSEMMYKQESRNHTHTCLWWCWGWNSMRWSESLGRGRVQRDRRGKGDTQSSHKWLTVPRLQHLPRRLPPLHYPATEPLLTPVHGGKKRGGGVVGGLDMCVGYITKKVFYRAYRKKSIRYRRCRTSFTKYPILSWSINCSKWLTGVNCCMKSIIDHFLNTVSATLLLVTLHQYLSQPLQAQLLTLKYSSASRCTLAYHHSVLIGPEFSFSPQLILNTCFPVLCSVTKTVLARFKLARLEWNASVFLSLHLNRWWLNLRFGIDFPIVLWKSMQGGRRGIFWKAI